MLFDPPKRRIRVGVPLFVLAVGVVDTFEEPPEILSRILISHTCPFESGGQQRWGELLDEGE